MASLLAFTTVAFLPTAASAQVPADEPLRRLLYFYEQRAFPYERVPAAALQRAYRQMRARWPDVVAYDEAADFTTSSSAWTAIGPAPINTGSAGRVSTVAVHPDDPDMIYAGGAQGGVWKSTDAGLSWNPLTDNECSLAMGAIAIDPVDPDIVYAGTGELHFSGDSYYGCGILRSTNGGGSWTQLGSNIFDTSTGGARVSRLLIDSQTAGSTAGTTVLAASSVGVYISRNSGLGWTRTLNGVATDLARGPGNVIYAAIGVPAGSSANGVYRSSDGGSTWQKLTGFPTAEVGRIALAASPNTPGVVYAAVQDRFGGGGDDGRLLGIWKTTDAGTTWDPQPATGAGCGRQCWYNLVIATDPLDPEIVYFGGVNLYRSDDGGLTFVNIRRNVHVDQHALTFDPSDPGTLYVGNDGGVFRSRDGGTSWTGLNQGLSVTQFYAGISLHPSDSTVVIGGTQDNGTLEFSGSSIWSSVLGGDGGYTAIDHQDPDFAWAETQWTSGSSFSGPRLRIGPGAFTTRKVDGIDIDDRALFIPPLVMDRTNSSVLYFGTFRVYRTANRGEFWNPISGDLSRTGNGRISAIAPAPSDTATIYVGTSDGNLQVTRDNGITWQIRRTGLPERFITDIAINGLDPDVAIATVSGFGTGHVFRTEDGGATWIDISGNLPDVPVNAALTDPALGTAIYVGTDLGVFRTNDFGASWEPFSAGLPNVAVFDIAYDRRTGIAAAGTHGRGVFVFRPIAAAAIAIARDSIRFTALGDTMRLVALVSDVNGDPFPGVIPSWHSLDEAIASVDAAGVVRAVDNGRTEVVALLGSASDTVRIHVEQVATAIDGLPASMDLVVGETRLLGAQAVDAGGQPLAGRALTWTSDDPDIANVDQTGTLAAVGLGATRIHVMIDQITDSSRIAVEPPATAEISAAAIPGQTRPSSEAGTRVALLALRIRVDGIEAVRLTAFGFNVSGDDPGAVLELIHDRDASGLPDAGEPIIASSPVSLRAGQSYTALLETAAFEVQAGGDELLIATLRLSGATPHNTAFQTTWLPERTTSVATRSGAIDRLVLPAAPVASDPVRSSLLGAGQVLSFSENPVRSASVTFNFRQEPTVAAIYTIDGRLVIDLTRGMDDSGRVDWDLRNGRGDPVAPGVYLVVFNVGGTVMRERLMVLRRDDGPAAADRQSRRHEPLPGGS